MGGTHARNAKRFISRLVKHGASHVPMPEFVAQAQIIWSIRSDQEISEACLHADEFMLSAARTCRRAQSIMPSDEAWRRQEGLRLDDRS